MKSIICLASFFFVMTTCFAQDVYTEASLPELPLSLERTTMAVPSQERVTAANTIAISQLSSFIGKNLEYPAAMVDYALEGHVYVVVELTPQGIIKQATAQNSALPKAFGEQIIQTLESFQGLKLANPYYVGNRKVRLSVQFSL